MLSVLGVILPVVVATTGAGVCFRLSGVIMRQYTEAFGRFLVCMCVLLILGNLDHYFVLPLYLTVTCPMFGCCRAEYSALDFRGDDSLGAQHLVRRWIHVMLQYVCFFWTNFPHVLRRRGPWNLRCSFSVLTQNGEACSVDMHTFTIRNFLRAACGWHSA